MHEHIPSLCRRLPLTEDIPAFGNHLRPHNDFCPKFIRSGSRTRDKIEQAARSGKQNIAEGSEASRTSKETEIKLTNVTKASLE